MNQKNRGFTLMELMIVVTVLVIISIAIFLSINPLTQFFRGYDTVRKSDLAKLKTAYENYYGDHSCYPDSSIISQCGSAALVPYLDVVPCDPTTKEPYDLYLLPLDSSCAQKFAIYATLSNVSDAKGDLITYCKDTISVFSTDMNNVDVIKGCSDQQVCQTMYGCKSGACVIVAEDSVASCSPNSCDPTCGVDCSKRNRRGSYVNECRAI